VYQDIPYGVTGTGEMNLTALEAAGNFPEQPEIDSEFWDGVSVCQ